MKRFKTLASLLAIGSLAFFLRWLPTFWAYLKRGKRVFLGASSLFSLDDIWVYWADILVGKKGHFLFVNQFGSGPQGKFLIKPFYVFLGHFARILNLSVELSYILASFFSAFVLAGSLYFFSKLFFKEKRWRLLAVGTALLSGPLSIAVTFPAIPFLSLLYPHFILVQSLIVLVFYAFLKLEKESSLQRKNLLNIIVFLSGFFLSLIHAYMNILVIFILCIWILVSFLFRPKRKLISPFIIFFVASAPMLAYSFFLTKNYLFSRIFIDRNILPSPRPLKIFSQLGICLLLIPLAFKKTRKNPLVFFLFIWLIVQPLFAYLPVHWQVRFLEGWWIPVSLLSVLGFSTLYQKLKKKSLAWSLLSISLIACLLFSLNLGVIFTEMFFSALLEPSLYVSHEESHAWNFLKKRCQFSTVLLSDPARGMYLPAKTGCRSFIGHGIQTFDYYRKRAQVEKLLTGKMIQAELESFIKTEEISFVFLPLISAQQAGLEKIEKLKPVFNNEEFIIYKAV
jgi:hypothetical protein